MNTTMTPRIDRVAIEDNGEYIVVGPIWAVDGLELDRPYVGGISTGRKMDLAKRLEKAMLAGAIYGPAEVRTDVNGKTYVCAPSKVLGRTLNADLKRLGY